MAARNFRKSWALKLNLPYVKPKRQVRGNNLGLGLHHIAQFMHSLPPIGSNRVIVEKLSSPKCAFIVGNTLHVRALHLKTKNELKYISLVTHFQLVDEVRIHTYHINHYLTPRKLHTRIQPVRWEVVKFILQFVHRGPWVAKETGRERAIKVTFDDFLKPIIEVWRSGKPFAGLVYDLPKEQAQLISSSSDLPWVPRGVRAYIEDEDSSDAELDVDAIHRRESHNEDIVNDPFDPDFFMSLLS